jgi:hypothetical protein
MNRSGSPASWVLASRVFFNSPHGTWVVIVLSRLFEDADGSFEAAF